MINKLIIMNQYNKKFNKCQFFQRLTSKHYHYKVLTSKVNFALISLSLIMLYSESEISREAQGLVNKLEELLRYYRMVKKKIPLNNFKDVVQGKCNDILSHLERCPEYKELEEDIKKKVEKTFSDAKPPAAVKKVAKAPSSKVSSEISSIKAQQSLEKKDSFSGQQSISGRSNSSKVDEQNSQNGARSINSNSKVNNKPESLRSQIVKQPTDNPSFNGSDVSKAVSNKNKQIGKYPQKKVQNQPASNSSNETFKNLKSNSVENGISFSNLSNVSIIKTANQQKNLTSLNKLAVKEPPSKQQLISINKMDEKVKRKNSNESEDQFLNLLKQDDPIMPASVKEQIRKMNQLIEDDSEKMSEASQFEDAVDLIGNFCRQNKEKLNTQLLFNDDLFDSIEPDEDGFAYLFGVSKPESKKMQKLYACTIMKFAISEVLKCNNLLDKECKDFKNNIRTPLGLIIKGQDHRAIQPEHIKFLSYIQSPFQVILVLKDLGEYDGVLCYFQESITNRIRITPTKQLGSCATELTKKTSYLPFSQQLLADQNSRFVITKTLNRTIASTAEQAPNAITITDNECIREEKNTFNYKLHTKFLQANNKPDFAIYFVNNNCANARLGFKDIEQFRKQALQVKNYTPAIFSFNMSRENLTVPKEFFEILIECWPNRDPFFFINLTNLNTKKTIIATLNRDAKAELPKSVPMPFKIFEKDTSFTNFLYLVTVKNIKQFETENKVELFEMKK